MIIYVPSSGDPRKPQPAAGRWSGADHKKLMLLGCLCILSGVIEIARVFIRDSLLGNPHPSAIAGSAIGGLVVWVALRTGTGYGFGWLGARLWVCALASMSLSAVDIVVSAAALLLKGEPQQLPSPLIFLAAAVTLVFDALLGVGGGWLGSTRQAGRPVAIGCATVLLVAGASSRLRYSNGIRCKSRKLRRSCKSPRCGSAKGCCKSPFSFPTTSWEMSRT